MITTEGKIHIQRALAGYVPTPFARSMAFGIGNKTETIADASLQLEVTRAPISLVRPDFTNNKLTFKGTVPAEYAGKIMEIGLYSLEQSPVSEGAASRLITTFDSGTEVWSPQTFTSVATRVGPNSLALAPAASATSSSVLNDMFLNLSDNSSADEFIFAFNSANANAASVGFRLKTDANNYYAYTVSNPSAGYQIVNFTKGSASVTGSPDWSRINQIEVFATSKSSGAASVELDAIRMEDRDSASYDYVLIARKVLATPVVVIDGQPLDFEFSLDVAL